MLLLLLECFRDVFALREHVCCNAAIGGGLGYPHGVAFLHCAAHRRVWLRYKTVKLVWDQGGNGLRISTGRCSFLNAKRQALRRRRAFRSKGQRTLMRPRTGGDETKTFWLRRKLRISSRKSSRLGPLSTRAPPVGPFPQSNCLPINL